MTRGHRVRVQDEAPAPSENTWVNKDAIAKSLMAKLSAHLDEIEVIDALVAAAHLDAAINALRRQFAVAGIASVTDEATQDG